MVPSRLLPLALSFAALALACAPARGQTEREVPEPQLKVHSIHKTVERPMPFAPGSELTLPVHSIEFRSPDKMTEKDRDVEADGESSIRERAGFDGLEFNQGKWSYQQLVCPALPHHLLLRFTLNNGRGDVSVFSASIPRLGDGRVRIIPIQRRGYSLFSPAPINALTISAFNHIRAEERSDQAPDWLTTGLCYAALAGAHPETAAPADTDQTQKLPIAPLAVLTIPNQGGAVIRFTDISAIPRPMEWTMTFDPKGKLLKAAHAPASLVTVKDVLPAPVDEKGIPVQPAPVDLNGKPRQ